MASLWFGAGSNRNPPLWRREVLHKIQNQSQQSSRGGWKQRGADVWPGIRSRLHKECTKLNTKKERKCLLSASFKDFFLFVRQIKLCHWGLTRSPMYGFLKSSRWRTQAFWATKFSVFAAISPFTGSDAPIRKVAYFSFLLLCADSFTASLSLFNHYAFPHSLFRSRFFATALLICRHTCQIMILRAVETLEQPEYTPRLKSSAKKKKSSSLVSKKNDPEICRAAWNHCC